MLTPPVLRGFRFLTTRVETRTWAVLLPRGVKQEFGGRTRDNLQVHSLSHRSHRIWSPLSFLFF